MQAILARFPATKTLGGKLTNSFVNVGNKM